MLVSNEATLAYQVIVGTSVLQSFYATFSYDTEKLEPGTLTLSLSHNAQNLATLNGYDYVERKIDSQTRASVIWITCLLVVVLIGTVLLVVKNPKNVQAKFKSTLDTSFEDDT